MSLKSIKFTNENLVILLSTVGLLTIGMIMIFSTSSIVGLKYYNNSFFFIKKHIIFLILGSVMCVLGYRIPYTKYKKIAFAGFCISTVITYLSLVPGIGVEVGGAKRWINLVLFKFQPVEMLKFFVITYTAVYLHNKRKSLHEFQAGILPLLVILAVPLFIIALQPDLGNVLLIVSVIASLFLLSQIKILHLIGLGFSAIMILIFYIFQHPYQMSRIKAFLFPWEDPLGRSYHILQSFTAIGSGGLFGLGIGQSKLKYFYLPLNYSDFIFSVICEEGGFILGGIVVLLFFIFFVYAMKIVKKSKDPFTLYLSCGLVLLLLLQAVINIAVVIGLLPVTGIPLTFISYGGTSLVVSLFFVGVLLNINKYNSVNNNQQQEPSTDDDVPI